jgi:hypothetical protein
MTHIVRLAPEGAGMYEDEDNDGRFPDESPVEVRYPRSKQEEQGNRERWPWLPGTIVEQCEPDEWYVCIEVRELAVLRDGRRAPRGAVGRNLYYPCCFRDAPRLGRFMLWLGIAATIGANIAYGAGYGLLGALISAWPAVAFIGSVEIAMQQVRRSRVPRAAIIVPAVPRVPGDVEQAVRAAYAASVAAGQPLSQRAMAGRFGLSRRKVSQFVAQVTASGNGHLPEGEAA